MIIDFPNFLPLIFQPYQQAIIITKRFILKGKNIIKTFEYTLDGVISDSPRGENGFGFDEIFGRSAVMELLGLKGSGASKLLSNLVQVDISEPVPGHGKGKYKFKK